LFYGTEENKGLKPYTSQLVVGDQLGDNLATLFANGEQAVLAVDPGATQISALRYIMEYVEVE